jgi:hypothetical protein
MRHIVRSSLFAGSVAALALLTAACPRSGEDLIVLVDAGAPGSDGPGLAVDARSEPDVAAAAADGGPVDGRTVVAGDAGPDVRVPAPTALWPADATKLVAASRSDGDFPAAPAGSDCQVPAVTYTFSVPTRELSWQACSAPTLDEPRKIVTGKLTLSGPDRARLDAAMAKLVVNTSGTCPGADFPDRSIAVTSPSGERTVHDSIYACRGMGRTYVDNMDDVFVLFDELSRKGTTGATAIWPADATKLVVENRGGGFRPQPPAGSECNPAETFTYTTAPSELAWRICKQAAAGQPYRWTEGKRAIAAADRARIDEAMGKLKVVTEAPCGADKPEYVVTVTSPAGERAYYDDFYICRGMGRTYVDGIDAPFVVMRDLAK